MKKKVEVDYDAMMNFGFTCKDMNGNPFFLPLKEGGYTMNAKCSMTAGDFQSKLRTFLAK